MAKVSSSKASSLVLGVVAGAAMFSAIQYASGNDLRGTLTDRDIASNAMSANTDADTVNRSAKGDRAAMTALAERPSQTVAFHLQGLSDTSVLVRVAAAPAAPRNTGGKEQSAGQPSAKEQSALSARPQRAAVACEPPVSVLTDVAKLLQPGRCVT